MNTAPKLHERLKLIVDAVNAGDTLSPMLLASTLNEVLAALAPPSGEGVDIPEAVEIQSSELVGEFAMGQFAIDMGNGVVRVVGIEFARGWNEARLAMRDHIYTATPQSAPSGEAVAAAWMLRRKRDDFVRGCYATKPTAESMEFAELDGDYYAPLYASPPATVDVGAK